MSQALMTSMNTTDYTRSFIQFTVDSWDNTPRTAVDASCSLISVDGSVQNYVLSNACIGEHMYVSEGLVQRPGTEFLQIVSNEQFTYIKDAGGACPDLRTAHVVGERMPTYDGKGVVLHDIDLQLIDHAQMTPITSHEQACEAILDNRVINARTSYVEPADGTTVVMDYQVRCCNVANQERRWQVDTGRILALSSSNSDGDGLAGRLSPAYIVYNDWDYAELAVLDLSADGKRAAQYNDIRQVKVKNELFLVDR